MLIKEREVRVRVNPKCWGTVGWCEQLLQRQSNDAVYLFVPHMVNIGPQLDERAMLPFEFQHFLYQPPVASIKLWARVLLHGHELSMAHDHAGALNLSC